MFLRSTLLTGAFLALAAIAPIRAQELQLTFSGGACALSASLINCLNGGPPPQIPFTVSFDINTASAQLSPQFLAVNGVNSLGRLLAEVTGTNFSAELGGVGVPLPWSSPVAIQLTEELFGGYEFDLETNPFSAVNGFAGPFLTQAQYQAFKNPLFSMLAGPGTDINGGEGGGLGDEMTGIRISAASVAEPGVIPLLLSGMAGLWFTRRKRAIC
jgi:hypothetical protein